jgi:CSLREA domain-containing protein
MQDKEGTYAQPNRTLDFAGGHDHAATSGLAYANPTSPQATWTVTKQADTNDGACNSACSLREAVRAANAAGGANTIAIPAGTYTLDCSLARMPVAGGRWPGKRLMQRRGGARGAAIK